MTTEAANHRCFLYDLCATRTALLWILTLRDFDVIVHRVLIGIPFCIAHVYTRSSRNGWPAFRILETDILVMPLKLPSQPQKSETVNLL